MRTCAAIITVNDPLLMDCALARYRQVLDPCIGTEVTYTGAAYYEVETPVLHREPVRSRLHASPKVPDRVLSRQFFLSGLSSGDRFRPEDTPPFRFRRWILASSGVLELAPQAPDKLAIPLHISRSVAGRTSAEQILHQYGSFLQGAMNDRPETQRIRGYRDALRSTLSLDDQWFPNEQARDLAIMIGDGRHVVGATLARPLWYEHVHGLDSCEACGGDFDGKALSHDRLRCTAVVDAPACPGEGWAAIEQNHLFTIERTGEMEILPLHA